MDVKFSTIFGFVVLRKPDWEEIQCELTKFKQQQFDQECFAPLCSELSKKLNDANKRIEELEKYKKLYADEFQKRLELIRLMEDKHET